MAHDIARTGEELVRDRAAHDHAGAQQRPGHRPAVGWIVPTGVAAAAGWAAGWMSGVRWAWGEMGPRHRTGTSRRT